MASQLAFSYNLPNNLSAFGIISDVISCDSTNTYITVSDNNIPLSIDKLYLVDFTTQSISFLCNTPGVILGAATPNEFLASDCSVRLDLDADDSSTAPGSDFQAAAYCGGIVALADSDAVLYSGYHLDSLRVELLPPAPDGAAEYVSLPNLPATLGLSGNGSHWLSLKNLGAAKQNDWEDAIRALRWQDDALSVSPGNRTIQVIAFAGLHSDTAFAFLPVPPPRSAGRDTLVSLCADAPALTLTTLLAPEASSGGVWSPVLPALFDPALQPSTIFQYILPDQECPGDTASIQVLVQPLPVFSLGPDQSVCAGQVVNLGPVPAAAQWQDGSASAIFQAALTGLYWAEVTDTHGCRFRDSVQANVLPAINSSIQATVCDGEIYTWNGSLLTAAGIYTDTLQTAAGCDSIVALALDILPAINNQLSVSTCPNVPYTWNGKLLTVAGIYIDTLQTAAGCDSIVALTLNILPAINSQLSVSTCPDVPYTWNGKLLTIAGTYTDTLQTAAGCDSIVALTLNILPAINSQLSVSTCPYVPYAWNGKLLTVAGIYTDTLQTAAGCDSIVALTLNILPAPEPLLPDTLRFCPGQSVYLEPGAFANYAWSDGNITPQIAVGQMGIYSVTVTNAAGCTALASTLATAYPEIMAIWETIDPLCPGSADGLLELTSMTGGQGPFQYSLNNGPLLDSPVFSHLPAGDWSLQIVDAVGCKKSYLLNLQNPAAWTVDLGSPPLLEVGIAYTIPLQTTGAGPFQYAWSPASTLSCAECSAPEARPLSITTFTVTVTDANGCTQTASLTIRLQPKTPDLYIPNAFKPNGDGLNDYFKPFGDPLAFQNTALLRIYDRWGDLVYEGQDLNFDQFNSGWNGQNKGNACSPGIYSYYAELRLLDGLLLKQAGEVLLLR